MDTKRQAERASGGLSDPQVCRCAEYTITRPVECPVHGEIARLRARVSDLESENRALEQNQGMWSQARMASKHNAMTMAAANAEALKRERDSANGTIARWIAATGCATPEEWEASDGQFRASLEAYARGLMGDANDSCMSEPIGQELLELLGKP